MKFVRILYFISFFAPVAFLLGYMMGAPRPAAPMVQLPAIDTRPMPASLRDVVGRESASIVIDGQDWIKPNEEFAKPVRR